jgi:hypothetical protein
MKRMGRIKSQDLIKIGVVTLFGLMALLAFVFWLKGHKFHNYEKFTFYFRNVNGLEEGAALRWNGLKIGVVESIRPVSESFEQGPFPSEALMDLGKRHLGRAIDALNSNKIEDLILARENVNRAQLEIALGKASNLQTAIIAGDFVQVRAVVTMEDVPIGPLNQVTIVPSGVIGEQYVDIMTIDVDEDYRKEFNCTIPKFVVLEPIRLDSLIRSNVESAEAITNLTNRINALFGNDDAENIKKLIEATTDFAQDLEFRENIKESAENVKKLTKDFKIWKVLF